MLACCASTLQLHPSGALPATSSSLRAMSSTPSIRVYDSQRDSHHYQLPHHRRPSIPTPAVAMAIPRVCKLVFPLLDGFKTSGALCGFITREIAPQTAAKPSSLTQDKTSYEPFTDCTNFHRHAKSHHLPCLHRVTSKSEVGKTLVGNGVTQTVQGIPALAEIGSRQLDLARACTVEPQAAIRGSLRSICLALPANLPSLDPSTA